MIAFGLTVSEAEPYHRYAEPGIRRAAEPDSEVFAFASVGTLGRGYNLLLDAAAARDDLEALVILHSHTEIVDSDLTNRIRAALSDPRVAIAGPVGASAVTSLAWWEGRLSRGRAIQRYTEHGGGDLPAYVWSEPTPPPAEVDALDGFMLVLSPWAVRNLRFDEGLLHGHGFDLDLCLRARAAGRTVITFDAAIIFHRSLEFVSDQELWVEAHIAIARKWSGALDGAGAEPAGGWHARARRAEAEREAARALAYSRRLANDARVEGLERELQALTDTPSWRLTRPLRQLNLWRRGRRARRRRAETA